MNNTQDISQFGFRELKEAARLLTAYTEADKNIIGDGIHIEFNPNSGNVFLVDEDYRVAMMNEDVLEEFFSCPICGHEGFLDDMYHNENNDDCAAYCKEIGARKWVTRTEERTL